MNRIRKSNFHYLSIFPKISSNPFERRAQRKENLEAAAGFEGGGVVDHLENEGAAAAHLDLADVEAEPKDGFEERVLAVGLATQGHDFRDRQLLPEGHAVTCRRL
jgi:hypothetical protein